MILEQRQEQQQSILARFVHAILVWINYLLSLIRKDYQAAETLLISLIGAWSVTFLWNAYIGTDLFASSRIYDPMAERGSQLEWAFFALALVTWWSVAVASQTDWMRVIGQIFMIRWYSYLAFVFFQADTLGWAAICHLIGTVYSVWVFWRWCGRRHDHVS